MHFNLYLLYYLSDTFIESDNNDRSEADDGRMERSGKSLTNCQTSVMQF